MTRRAEDWEKGRKRGVSWGAAVTSVLNLGDHIMACLTGTYLCPPVVVVESSVHLSQLPKELVLVSVQLGNNSDRDKRNIGGKAAGRNRVWQVYRLLLFLRLPPP